MNHIRFLALRILFQLMLHCTFVILYYITNLSELNYFKYIVNYMESTNFFNCILFLRMLLLHSLISKKKKKKRNISQVQRSTIVFDASR